MAKQSKKGAVRSHDSPLSNKKVEIPPGATKRASDRDLRPGEPPSHLDDRHAAGTPAGGTEIGGLAGTNFGEGDPDIGALNEAMGNGTYEPEGDDESAYAGPSGGALGGTPAGKRSRGGRTRRGIKPGGTHRGDSTIGADPENAND